MVVIVVVVAVDTGVAVMEHRTPEVEVGAEGLHLPLFPLHCLLLQEAGAEGLHLPLF